MAARRFTDSYLVGLPTKPKPYKVRDASDVRGFGIQVSNAGTRSFFLLITVAGKQRFIGLGRYTQPIEPHGNRPRETSNLVERRDFARRLRAAVERGDDPDVWIAEQTGTHKRRGTFGDLLDRYLESLIGRPSHSHSRQIFDRDIRPSIDTGLPAAEITPGMITNALAKIVRRGALVQANRAHSYLSAAFTFGLRFDHDPSATDRSVRFFLSSNPVSAVARPQRAETEGERNLSADELRALWRTLDTYTGMSNDMKAALRLLIVTGQRVETVLYAPFDEFDMVAAIWDIPPDRMKKKRAHVVPLHRMAVEIIDQQRERHGRGWLFPAPKSNQPMTANGIARAVARFCQRTGFEKFTPRDLRRTWKSRGGEIGIPKVDRDRLQAHAIGADVSSRHYDRHDYLAEKRIAMDCWGDWLSALVADDNVVPIACRKVSA